MNSKLENHQGPLLASLERRLFLRRGLSLGALSLLAGCDLTYDENVQKVLTAMSRWFTSVNDPSGPVSRVSTTMKNRRVAAS